jgi:hypothetical protein
MPLGTDGERFALVPHIPAIRPSQDPIHGGQSFAPILKIGMLKNREPRHNMYRHAVH